MRVHTLHALVQLGQAERAEAALAGFGEQERQSAEIRTALASLRLGQDDPQVAASSCTSWTARSPLSPRCGW
jgi:hypothetical protein